MKLKNNWREKGMSVYDNGLLRIHVGGSLVRTSDGNFHSKYNHKNLARLIKCEQIQGYNKIRGLMMWASELEDKLKR